MIKRRLGRTGLEVSCLCLGTMQFGWTAGEAQSFAVLDAYFEAGGNFIDTADIYSNWAPGNPGGASEEIIGRWLKSRGLRDKVVIATKVRGRMWPGPDGEGLGRAHIARAAEDSLRRLQVETIDLYQAHWFDAEVPIEETLSAFDALIRAGEVRYIGASNYPPGLLEEALRTADAKSLPRYQSLQPHYSLVHRAEYETALRAVCEREGLGVIPYSPLGGGFLTGKYRRGAPPPPSQRAEQILRRVSEQAWDVLDAVLEIAAAHRATPAAVALAWLLAQPTVTAPIIGANTPEQLAELLPASELRLTAEELARLDEASRGL